MTVSALLPSFPNLDQRNQATDDGAADENKYNNCGETVTSAFIDWMTGITVYPDTIKDSGLFLGQGNLGYSNENEIAHYLAHRCSTPAEIHYPTDKGSAMKLIRDSLLAGYGLIALRYFSAPDASDGHWVAVIGEDGPDNWHTDHVTYMNPWGGTTVTEDRDTFFSWLRDYPLSGEKCLITVNRSRDLFLP